MSASEKSAGYIDKAPLFSCLAATTWSLQMGLYCRISLILLRSSSGVLSRSNVVDSGLSSLTMISLSLLTAVVDENFGGVGG